VDAVVAVSAFAVIFPAELPDKTAVATLVLSARHRPAPVVAGVWAAFCVHVVIACSAGRAFALLPHRVVEGVSAAIFLLSAVLLARGAGSDESPADLADEELAVEAAAAPAGAATAAPWRTLPIVATAFGVVFLAEWGDFTQIATANLAARSGDPVSTGIGALLALWTVAALAATAGRSLLRVIPIRRVRQFAAVVCLGFAVYSAVSAITG
jgi:putative Ca2+/H+ antiporter (TMEM165/GDT1 family)